MCASVHSYCGNVSLGPRCRLCQPCCVDACQGLPPVFLFVGENASAGMPRLAWTLLAPPSSRAMQQTPVAFCPSSPAHLQLPVALCACLGPQPGAGHGRCPGHHTARFPIPSPPRHSASLLRLLCPAWKEAGRQGPADGQRTLWSRWVSAVHNSCRHPAYGVEIPVVCMWRILGSDLVSLKSHMPAAPLCLQVGRWQVCAQGPPLLQRWQPPACTQQQLCPPWFVAWPFTSTWSPYMIAFWERMSQQRAYSRSRVN